MSHPSQSTQGQSLTGEPQAKQGRNIHWPIMIAGVVTLLGFVLVAPRLNPGNSSTGRADMELRGYLGRLVIAQVRFFAANQRYAASLAELRGSSDTRGVLDEPKPDFRLEWRYANREDYCVMAVHNGGERWYTVGGLSGVQRTDVSQREAFTGTCQRPRPR
jgi:hypothetical protein